MRNSSISDKVFNPAAAVEVVLLIVYQKRHHSHILLETALAIIASSDVTGDTRRDMHAEGVLS